jgi:glutamate-ammonia-ligase adenylyltransferase
MELELGREDRGQLALKYGRGALVDVEFAAQAMQMTYGRDPRVRTPNTHAALVALRDAGHLPDELAAALLVGERTLRATLLAARLTTLRGTLVPSSPSAVTVARRMGYRDRGERTALEGLLADLARTRDAVRRAWRDTLTLLTARAEAAP